MLALTCHIELFTQAHYRESIERDDDLSDLYRDIFRFLGSRNVSTRSRTRSNGSARTAISAWRSATSP